MPTEKIKTLPKMDKPPTEVNTPKAQTLDKLVQTTLSIVCPKTGNQCSEHYCQYEGCQKQGSHIVIPSVPNPQPKPKETTIHPIKPN